MPSTSTTNTGIEKPGNGEQNGTWGNTANTDFDIIDRALSGVTNISLSGSSDSTTITTINNTLSTGQYRTFILGGSPTGTLVSPFALTVTPSTAQKIYFFRNTTSAYINVIQGTGTTKALIYPNATAIVYLDGANNTFDISSAFNYLSTINGGTVAGATTFSSIANFTNTVGINSSAPATTLEIKGDDSPVTQFTAAISGTVMTVSGIGTPSGALAAGEYIFGAGVAPNTYITSLGTGTGTTGTYNVSTSQTVASATMYAISATKNRMRFTDSDTAVDAGQPIGTVEFYTSDASTPGAGVGAFISAISETTAPDTALIFGTRNDTAGSVSAIEVGRFTSDGFFGLGTATPPAKLTIDAGSVVVANYATNAALFMRSASGTQIAPTQITAATILGAQDFAGLDNASTYRTVAQIRGGSDGTITSTASPGYLSFLTTPTGSTTITERARLTSAGSFGLGTTAPTATLEVSGSASEITTCTGYIYDGTTSGTAGTVLNVTAVSGAALAVGQYIYGPGITPNTYITAFITGSGTTGTYRISASQVLATSGSPSATIYVIAANTNRIRITDTDTAVQTAQPLGTLEFYTNDSDAPGGGVGAFVSAVTTTTAPDVDLVFGTRDNPAVNAGSGAVERMRISQSLISYTIPQAITGASYLAAGASITSTAADDGTKTTGTYSPTPIGGNMKRIINQGTFSIAAPTAAGDYTMIIQITNAATSAGTISLTGFSKTTGSALTTTANDDFLLYITKINGFTLGNVVALQ
jgi:hypothetical protein